MLIKTNEETYFMDILQIVDILFSASNKQYKMTHPKPYHYYIIYRNISMWWGKQINVVLHSVTFPLMSYFQ